MITDVWLAVMVLLGGLALLFFSSDRAVDVLIKLSSMLGASVFTIGFVVSAIGSDLPELVNSVISSFLGHGGISVGDSLGSVMTQISLVLGTIPFFCRFCRLIPRKFMGVGIVYIVVLIGTLVLILDNSITRADGIIMVALWMTSVFVLRKFEGQTMTVETSEKIRSDEKTSRLLLYAILSFVGIGISSYMIIEATTAISKAFNISEYIISFFLLAIGTSLPELAVAISAIKRRHYELALGDIIGSCIVDATLAIGLGPIFFPVSVPSQEIIVTGVYTVLLSLIVIVTLSIRGVNDKKREVSSFFFMGSLIP